jgi:hypothetical protein
MDGRGGKDAERFRAPNALLTYTIQPAFSPVRSVEIVASNWLDALDEANLRYPDLCNPHYFGVGKPEPWKISRIL